MVRPDIVDLDDHTAAFVHALMWRLGGVDAELVSADAFPAPVSLKSEAACRSFPCL